MLFRENMVAVQYSPSQKGSGLPKGSEGGSFFPSYSLFPEGSCPVTYLFSIDDDNYFLAETGAPLPKGFSFEPVRSLRGSSSRTAAFAGITAFHLSVWYRDNRFCGRCGHLSQKSLTERALLCPSCGNVIYPKISPAVIVAVTDGDRLLLSKYAHGEYRRESLLAGFTEIGENAESTVEREVFEETGLRVKHITYYKSQPWGLSGSLLLGYFAELDGSPAITLDTRELSEAWWMPRGEISFEDDGISLTGEMIRIFRDGM
ncbi:MAG: NAD(+) diphosphatase [Spirochaetaceae bacterium]|nr:NAD(+) diphosphatase [Spirochaetaceae bacterium]